MGPGNDKYAADCGSPPAEAPGSLLGTMRKGIASDRLGLSLSGPPMVDVRAEPDRDYADDTDLIYMRGGVDFRTRFTPADVVNVIAALSGAMPTAGEVVAGFLNERLEKARRDEKLAFGEIGPGPEVRALQRVIAMLEEK